MTTTEIAPAPTLEQHLAQAGCIDIKPVRVRIGRQRYEGAFYRQIQAIAPGCRAYEEGQRSHVVEALYLVGPLPAAYRRSQRVAFRLPGDGRDWYVAGWYPADLPNEYHPLGRMLTLRPWLDGEPIDVWAPRPYRRVDATITPREV